MCRRTKQKGCDIFFFRWVSPKSWVLDLRSSGTRMREPKKIVRSALLVERRKMLRSFYQLPHTWAVLYNDKILLIVYLIVSCDFTPSRMIMIVSLLLVSIIHIIHFVKETFFENTLWRVSGSSFLPSKLSYLPDKNTFFRIM